MKNRKRLPFNRMVLLFFILPFFLKSQALYASDFHPSYEISATFDIKEQSQPEIKGSVEFSFTNSSSITLKNIAIMLYPNRYLSAPQKQLPPELFKRSFAKPFTAGKMEVFDTKDSLGRPLKIKCPDTDLGKNVVCQILLIDPLPPGQFTTLTLLFTTL
ncbi:MAG: hypothetical protein ACHQYP_10655, partial [Nitrospiria bacterium]